MRRKQTMRSTEQVKKSKKVIWKKILSGFEWKFLLSKKSSHGLSTNMEKVPTVSYEKEQGCNRGEYVGFLNPITYWKMTKLYHLASRKLCQRKQNLNIIKMIKKWKRKGKGTVRTQIIEGNKNKNETEHYKIKGSLKSWQKAFILWNENTRLPETTMKNWPALWLKIFKKQLKKNATSLSVATFDELQLA